MKEIFSTPVGGDGGKVGLAVDGGALELVVSYPVAKILAPAKALILDKIKAAIPVQVVDDLLDKAWDEAVALLSESPPAP